MRWCSAALVLLAAQVVTPLATPAPSPKDAEVRKQVAKARRAVASEGLGGLKKRAGAKRSEQKSARPH